jgi:hypothetical protein
LGHPEPGFSYPCCCLNVRSTGPARGGYFAVIKLDVCSGKPILSPFFCFGGEASVFQSTWSRNRKTARIPCEISGVVYTRIGAGSEATCASEKSAASDRNGIGTARRAGHEVGRAHDADPCLGDEQARKQPASSVRCGLSTGRLAGDERAMSWCLFTADCPTATIRV